MLHRIFTPSDSLKPYIKHFWTCSTDQDIAAEIMYPSGYVELCIDLTGGNTMRKFNDRLVKTPKAEVLGHFTCPTRAKVAKGTNVLITRFYPSTISLFFPNPISNFTNDSIDLLDVLGVEANDFYDRIISQSTLEEKIKKLESFLICRLALNAKSDKGLGLVQRICDHTPHDIENMSISRVAKQFGYSERYLQKLFLEFVGVSPKRFFSIQRFARSLEMVQASAKSLTAVAIESGYYDQAHFIKEFKSYTGLTPSHVARLTADFT